MATIDPLTKEEGDIPGDILTRMYVLRGRSKRGQELSADDFAFLQDCYAKWPIKYAAIGREVFDETKPFGAL